MANNIEMNAMKLLTEVCSIPTAPFVEGRVAAWAGEFVRQRRKLSLQRDASGNLLILLPGKKRGGSRWIFTAHMDHPGLVSRRMIDARTVEADFRGWVLAEMLKGVKVRFFDGDRETTGRIVEVGPDQEEGRGARAAMVRVRVGRPVGEGVAGMFDVGVGRIKGKRFLSRVCDDLAGAAAALAMLNELHASPPDSTIGVLLTRAEEEGFIGAIAASRSPKLLRKTDRLIAIECSAVQPHAPQGAGPIIRVGDRTSIFNSAITYFLTQQAEELKKRDRRFVYQRALMPGGTCEATVYDVYGFAAGSICVALGNYHNMDRQKNRISAEYIDLDDWRNMVKLFVAVARNAHQYAGHGLLKKRIEKRYAGLSHLLNG